MPQGFVGFVQPAHQHPDEATVEAVAGALAELLQRIGREGEGGEKRCRPCKQGAGATGAGPVAAVPPERGAPPGSASSSSANRGAAPACGNG